MFQTNHQSFTKELIIFSVTLLVVLYFIEIRTTSLFELLTYLLLTYFFSRNLEWSQCYLFLVAMSIINFFKLIGLLVDIKPFAYGLSINAYLVGGHFFILLTIFITTMIYQTNDLHYPKQILKSLLYIHLIIVSGFACINAINDNLVNHMNYYARDLTIASNLTAQDLLTLYYYDDIQSDHKIDYDYIISNIHHAPKVEFVVQNNQITSFGIDSIRINDQDYNAKDRLTQNDLKIVHSITKPIIMNESKPKMNLQKMFMLSGEKFSQ